MKSVMNQRFFQLLFFLVMGLLTSGIPWITATVPEQSGPDENTMKLLSLAETLHELAALHIQKDDFPKAVAELRAILDLGLPVKYEEAVYKEVYIVARKLYDKNQKELCYQVLDMGFESIRTPEFKARLLSVRAALLKKDGRLDEAIETYKREVEIREKNMAK